MIRAGLPVSLASLAMTAAIAVACSSTPDGGASDAGDATDAGPSIVASFDAAGLGSDFQNAYAGLVTIPAGTPDDTTGATTTGLVLVLSDVAASCADYAAVADTGIANAHTIEIEAFSAGATFAVGDYPITAATAPTGQSSATANPYDGACKSPDSTAATAGEISITMVTTTEIDGTYDLTFASADAPTSPPAHLTGSFKAALCVSGTDADGGFDAGANSNVCVHP